MQLTNVVSSCTDSSFISRRDREILDGDDFRGCEKGVAQHKSIPNNSKPGPVLSESSITNGQNKENDFVKPTGSVPKNATYNKLKTLRINKYTPKKRKMPWMSSSPNKSVMSEFDAKLVNSAVSEILELDQCSDQSSSIWTNGNMTITETEVSGK